MTCIFFGGETPSAPRGVICVTPCYRLRVSERLYLWMEYHPYCGPGFFRDAGCTDWYEPVDENDPVWRAFDAWRAKREGR